MRNFPEHGKIVSLQVPASISAMAPKFGSLRNYYGAYIQIHTGAASAGGNAIVRQAKNVAGQGIKDLAVLRYFSNSHAVGTNEQEDLWTETDNSANSATVIALAANRQYVIPIKPAKLDVTNRFDCVGLEIAGATALLVSVALVLHDGPKGIVNDVRHIPSARINQSVNS